MFYISKIIWFLLSPINLILVLLSLVFIFNLINFNRLSKFFFFLTLLFFLISGILPIGSYLGYVLEKKYHFSNYYPNQVDGILILGGATDPYLSDKYNQVILNDSGERLIESVLLINKYPDAKIIFSGGSGSLFYPELDHATVAKKFFENMEINNNIIYEEQSRNTFENILYSKTIVMPKDSENWLLVTSAFHLNRSLAVASKLDWKLIPYATDFRHPKKFTWKVSFNFLSNFSEFDHSTHEWIGIIYYYFMGRLDSLN